MVHAGWLCVIDWLVGRVCLVCYRLLMFVFGLGSFVVGVVLLLWLIVFAVWFLDVLSLLFGCSVIGCLVSSIVGV